MSELAKWLIGICSLCGGSVYHIFSRKSAVCDECGAEKDMRPKNVIHMPAGDIPYDQ